MVFVSGDPLIAIFISEALKETVAEVAIFFAGASQVGVVFGFLRFFAFLLSIALTFLLAVRSIALAFFFLIPTLTFLAGLSIALFVTLTLLWL